VVPSARVTSSGHVQPASHCLHFEHVTQYGDPPQPQQWSGIA
jgi:hypothetical protein